MDAVTCGDLSLQAKRENSLLAAFMQPRAELTLTAQNSSPQPVAFQKTFTSTLPENNALLSCRGECEENRKHYNRPEDTELNALTEQNLTLPTGAELVSPDVSLGTADIDSEKSSFNDNHESNLNTEDSADMTSAVSHKSGIPPTDSLADCEDPGKELEDNTSGGCRPFTTHSNSETLMKSDIISLISVNTKDGYMSDCFCKDEPSDAGDIPYSRAPKGEETTDMEHECSNSDKTGGNGKKEVTSHIAACDNGDSNLSCEEDSCGNAAIGERGKIELQNCENVPVRNGGTESLVNENGTKKNTISASLKCTEGSVDCEDVDRDRNSAIFNDVCEKSINRAAGKMTTKPQSEKGDRTSVILMAARMSQEAAEGDNEPRPFSVIDPAITRNCDRVEEKICHSTGVVLSQSLKACEVKRPLPLFSDIGLNLDQTECFLDQSRKESKEENKDFSQLSSETTSYSGTVNEMHDVNGDEGSCRQTSFPSRHRPENLDLKSREDRHTCLSSLGNQIEEQNHSCLSFVDSEHQKTQEFQPRILVMDVTHETRERQELAKLGKYRKFESVGFAEDTYLDQSEEKLEVVEISSVDVFDDMIVDISENCGETLLPHEQRASLCWYDHSYSANNIANEEGKAEMENCELIKTPYTEFMTNEKKNGLLEYKSRAEDNGESKMNHFYLTSETLLPRPHGLSPRFQSRNVVTNSSALNSVAPAPSVLTHPTQLQREFDIFEKICLSPDDDDNDQDLGVRRGLTSLQGQLLKTPQKKLHQTMPGEEGIGPMFITQNEAENKDKVENSKSNFEKKKESVSNDLNVNGHQSDQTIQELNTDKSFSRKSDHTQSDSEFEMKSQFEMVLKELKMYFEISRDDLDYSYGATSHVESHAKSDGRSSNKKHLSSPEDLDLEDSLAECSQKTFGGVSAVSTLDGSHCGEQEVPCGSFLCMEESMNTREEQRELQSPELKRKWCPSFDCSPVMEQRFPLTADNNKRLGPLRTCMRPIRVGLSKKAKPKRLHRHHPSIEV